MRRHSEKLTGHLMAPETYEEVEGGYHLLDPDLCFEKHGQQQLGESVEKTSSSLEVGVALALQHLFS